jgi:hypothetical protein
MRKIILEDIYALDFQYYIEAVLNQYEYEKQFEYKDDDWTDNYVVDITND